MALITPTTELEAVNECLENIGEAPVNTISGDLGVDTQTALNTVRKVNRELQAMGWYWNTEYEYPIAPNADNDILLPANTLSVRPDGQDRFERWVQRGTRLYDRENRTFGFTRTVYLRLTLGLDFTELPETARRYIAMRAARFFQDRLEGRISEDDVRDERLALADLKADDARVVGHNALTDNFSTYLTLTRRPFGGVAGGRY